MTRTKASNLFNNLLAPLLLGVLCAVCVVLPPAPEAVIESVILAKTTFTVTLIVYSIVVYAYLINLRWIRKLFSLPVRLGERCYVFIGDGEDEDGKMCHTIYTGTLVGIEDTGETPKRWLIEDVIKDVYVNSELFFSSPKYQ